MRWQILTVDELDAQLLTDVREERIAGVRVAAYCTPEVADRLARALVSHRDRTNYQARWARRDGDGVQPASGFAPTDTDRVGPVDTTPDGEPDQAQIRAAIREIRAAAAPGLGPIDRLRLELDEIVPGGAGLLRGDGRARLAGVGRIMERAEYLVHADTGRRNCLTANVYLRVPRDGGGTRIWKYDGAYRQSEQSYLFGPDEIPSTAPLCLLVPEPGDLVIWNPAVPHAVLPFEDAPRVSLQTWLLVEPATQGSDFAVRLVN
jgi:hypothetical protein